MLRICNEIWIPNAKRLREELRRPHQVVLLMLDVYWAHFLPSVLDLLATNDIKVIPVEPGLTGLLQPCDHPCGVNRVCKPLISSMNDAKALERMCKQLSGVAPELLQCLKDDLLPPRTQESPVVLAGGEQLDEPVDEQVAGGEPTVDNADNPPSSPVVVEN